MRWNRRRLFVVVFLLVVALDAVMFPLMQGNLLSENMLTALMIPFWTVNLPGLPVALVGEAFFLGNDFPYIITVSLIVGDILIAATSGCGWGALAAYLSARAIRSRTRHSRGFPIDTNARKSNSP